jgi:hypothetical protein
MLGWAGILRGWPPKPEGRHAVFDLTLTDDQLLNYYPFEVEFHITAPQEPKQIDTGNGTQIFTAPGMRLTISADIDGDGVLTEVGTFKINGTTKATFLDDGTVEYVYNGPAFNIDPHGVGDPYKLISGHYTYASNADNTVVVSPLQGHGPFAEVSDYLFV